MAHRFSLFGGPATATHKLIVGVDFGTTYTGVSYVSSTGAFRDIVVIQNWTGPSREAEVTWKTPSRIAYSSENEAVIGDQWGYLVSPRMKSYSWFKLLLDRGIATQFDDPALSATEGPNVLRVPRGKMAKQVCADYLKHVYKFTMTTLDTRLSPDILRITPIEFWFTCPAIWSDGAKNDTLDAARAAGFAQRPGDNLCLITEPEAAAVATLKGLTPNGVQNQITDNDAVLVCDCGGGTVDLTSYLIRKINPTLEFDELLVGQGGKCGSTYIDRQFHQWMSNKFGRAFERVAFEKKAPGSKLMKEFECIKRDFGSSEVADFEVSFVMEDVEDSENYDSVECLVKFTSQDLESMFRPVVQKVLELIAEQVRTAQVEQGRRITKIILVGGFGDSRFLLDNVRSWAERNGGPRVICPDRPQAAIVLGAALRGLGGIAPKTRRCRHHYGFQLDLPYNSALDDERHSYIAQFDHSKRARGTMIWPIRMGAEINEDTFITQPVKKPWYKGESLVFTLSLYRSSAEHPPRREEHPRVQNVGSIKVDLTTVNMNKFKKRWKFSKDKKIWQLEYELQILFGKREGVLMVRAKVGDEVVGTTNIEYAHD